MSEVLPTCPCWIEYRAKGKYTQCPYEYEKDCRVCERMKEVENNGVIESK